MVLLQLESRSRLTFFALTCYSEHPFPTFLRNLKITGQSLWSTPSIDSLDKVRSGIDVHLMSGCYFYFFLKGWCERFTSVFLCRWKRSTDFFFFVGFLHFSLSMFYLEINKWFNNTAASQCDFTPLATKWLQELSSLRSSMQKDSFLSTWCKLTFNVWLLFCLIPSNCSSRTLC